MHRSPLGCSRVCVATVFSGQEIHFLTCFFPCAVCNPLPTPQTGHTHFYHRSCPAFKGGCPAPITGKSGHTISPPVHIMVGNGGFQPGASVFNETPAWIDVESFNYGYCSLEASQTQMTLQVSDTGRFWTPYVTTSRVVKLLQHGASSPSGVSSKWLSGGRTCPFE